MREDKRGGWLATRIPPRLPFSILQAGKVGIMYDETELAAMRDHSHLQDYCTTKLIKRGRDNFVCPICESGTHSNRTAAFSIKDGRAKCFSCGFSGDIFDIVGAVENIDGFPQQVEAVSRFTGVHVSSVEQPARQAKPKPKPEPPKDYTEGRNAERAKLEKWRADYLEEIENEDGELFRYVKDRRIMEYGCPFGYDREAKRLVIPYPGSDYYHIDRDITGNARNKYRKPKSDNVGAEPLFNPAALDETAFFVVEGALDAMAIEAAGYKAVALGTTGYRNLLDELVSRGYQGGVILMLDNDEAGRNAQARFLAELQENNIAAYEFEYPANELTKDPDGMHKECDPGYFKRTVGECWSSAVTKATFTDRYPNMQIHDPGEVAASIYIQEDVNDPIATGFRHLDAMLGGGLQRGLYVMGATSSFGKTTIAVQIADAIAAAGQPVLFVTIEQSAQEIVAKSLSRITAKHGEAISAQEIMNNKTREQWSIEQYGALMQAANEYSNEVAPNLRILEGRKKPTVSDVKAAAMAMRATTGKAPVVLIDYLQLLEARDMRFTDKQAVDDNVTFLRQFARDLKTPVWCVATLNRESYSGAVEFESFKESGAIEYGADVLLGLQPTGIAAEVKNCTSVVEKKLKGTAFIDKAKRQKPREVEITILKNRNGETTGSGRGVQFKYDAKANHFTETANWQ